MTKKTKDIQYPFWTVGEFGNYPSKEASDKLMHRELNYIYQFPEIKTIGDVQDAMFFGVEKDKPLGQIPFHAPFPKHYIVAVKEFNYTLGGKTKDIFHAFAHVAVEAAHNFYGEVKVALAETVILGNSYTLTKYLSEKNSNINIDYAPASNSKTLAINLEFNNKLWDKRIYDPNMNFDSKINYHQINDFLDLKNSPEALSIIVQARYIDEKVLDNTGKRIGEHSGRALTKLKKELFRPTEKEKEEIELITKLNGPRPFTKINLSKLTKVARNTNLFVESIQRNFEISTFEVGF